jgi:phosphoribosylformylglycinamidine synthase PurS subunit
MVTQLAWSLPTPYSTSVTNSVSTHDSTPAVSAQFRWQISHAFHAPRLSPSISTRHLRTGPGLVHSGALLTSTSIFPIRRMRPGDARGFILCSSGTAPYNSLFMKAFVYVTLKRTVLDPQGKTIQGALQKMGYKGLEDVRQGKFFELTLDGGLTREQAQAEVERIAREVLTNSVIEEFRYTVEE